MKKHLYYFSAFLENNYNSSNFSLEIETTITSHNFDSYEFYSIFKSTFRKVQNKFNAYISLYPTLLF